MRLRGLVVAIGVIVTAAPAAGLASQSVEGTYEGQFQDAPEQPVGGAHTNEVTLVFGDDLRGRMALAIDGSLTFGEDSDPSCFSFVLDLSDQPVGRVTQETGGVSFDGAVTVQVGYADGPCVAAGGGQVEGREGQLTGTLDENGVNGTLATSGVELPFFAQRPDTDVTPFLDDDPLDDTPLTAEEIRRIRLASDCVTEPCPALDASTKFLDDLVASKPPNLRLTPIDGQLSIVVFLRELRTPGGARLVPALHAMTPVIMNLAGKANAGDERASTAFPRLIRLVLDLDMLKAP